MKTKLTSGIFFLVVLMTQTSFAQTLPVKIKTYLNKNYKGWKFSSTSNFCSNEYRRAVVSGDFNGNRKSDYAVKIIKGRKGYLLAFLQQNKDYQVHVLHSMTASETKNLALGVFRKGERYTTGDIEDENPSFIILKTDAPFDGPCASDTGGIHLYKNGKFETL